MIDLKSRNIKVDEMSLTSSFFLCPEQSARHFDGFDACQLDTMTQSARHFTVASGCQLHITLYIGNRNTSTSESQGKQVSQHA
jgi:hypothetical protein